MTNSANVEVRSRNWLEQLFSSSLQTWERRPARKEEMRFILDRERARTDRTDVPFSVIIFQAMDPACAPAVWQHLMAYLPSRLRITDDYGWLDDERLLVVLPGTDTEGTWRVADDVLNSLPTGLTSPQCEVLKYPAGWSSGSGDATGEFDITEEKKGASTMEPYFCSPLPRWKRGLDLVCSLMGLVAIAPLLLVIGAAIKLTSRGPVFFCQQRSGMGGHPFTIFKFRTMVVDAEAARAQLLHQNEQDGPAFKIRNDPRVTTVGWILRKTSMDELPQLWNVLRGDMTLVGPRPLPCHESDACLPWQRRRMDVTPGITCIWQVEGRSRVTFDEWVRMDVRYARLRSLMRDLKLLARTVMTVLTKADGC